MKSRALNILASALIVLSAFFFVPDLCLAEEEFVTQPVSISALVGKVELLLKDTPIWQEAKVGMQLNEGDKIRTSEGAKAELVFKDGSFIRLKEETTLGVKTAREEVSTKVTQYNLDFRIGEIMVELKKLKKGSSFKVETPTAVAAVRGTTYYMRTGTRVVDGEEKSFVEIYIDSDDTILFTNTVSGESCVVHQGESAILYDDGTVEGPYPIPPTAQDAWKSGFDIIYDDSDEGKKGMRDVDEEVGEDTGDIGEDIDDTIEGQNDAQNDANQNQNDERDISGLAKVDIITDSDGDGYTDEFDAFPNDPLEWLDTDSDGTGNNADTDDDNDGLIDSVEVDNVTNPLLVDTDGDTYDDFEDAFPGDDTVDPDTAFSKGYGSWEELHQAAVDALAIESLRELRGDIANMLNDIHARGYEALKENICDHQAGKVMADRWGNRVRVEEYISRPTNEQVRVLALNLRTAGPNAGISSFDFRTTFNRDISSEDLKSLPWGDYMNVYEREDLDNGTVNGALALNGDNDNGYDDMLLIGYESDPEAGDYPLPLPREFSVEVKNPYGDSVKAIESYLPEIVFGTIGGVPIWYQPENEAGNSTFLNGTQYFYADYLEPEGFENWGDGWNDANKYTFLDYLLDARETQQWLIGVFYLINNDGSLVSDVNDDYLDDQGELDILSVRNWINPEYNMEMVFFSSVFADTPFVGLPETIDEHGPPDYAYELSLYSTYRNIDVITIPEITEPYYRKTPPEKTIMMD